jgi:Zn-dependent protease with chaperone function
MASLEPLRLWIDLTAGVNPTSLEYWWVSLIAMSLWIASAPFSVAKMDFSETQTISPIDTSSLQYMQ